MLRMRIISTCRYFLKWLFTLFFLFFFCFFLFFFIWCLAAKSCKNDRFHILLLALFVRAPQCQANSQLFMQHTIKIDERNYEKKGTHKNMYKNRIKYKNRTEEIININFLVQFSRNVICSARLSRML